VSIIYALVPVPAVSRGCLFLIDHIYRTAVRVDSFWMRRVVGIELVIKGEPNSHAAPVVICNHQSWFDIPLIQEVITGRGPIVRFLIKRELVWVPVIGWICLALNFPRLRRNKKAGDRKSDLYQIQTASKKHRNHKGALLVFPEGTRLTEQKHARQKSPYQHLLRPKTGGLSMIQQAAGADTHLIDITINYHKKNVRIWECLHGDPRKITITLEHFALAEINDVKSWLHSRWLAKDRLLDPEQH